MAGRLRISGGILRGRFIEVPAGVVRPTQGRVRQALFSSIADRLAGARVLDLFAGSGVLGLEAFSRGAADVCWVESGRRTRRTLGRNVEALCAAGKVLPLDAESFLARGGDGVPFDLALADPPYAERWAARLFKALDDDRVLKPGGLFVIEHLSSPKCLVTAPPGWREVRRGVYGDTALSMFERDRR